MLVGRRGTRPWPIGGDSNSSEEAFPAISKGQYGIYLDELGSLGSARLQSG